MLKATATILICLGLFVAGLFAVTQSVIPQVFPVMLISVAVVLGLVSCKQWVNIESSLDLVIVGITFVYFAGRAYVSDVVSLANLDLVLIFSVASAYMLLRVWLVEGIYKRLVLYTASLLIVGNLLMFFPAVRENVEHFFGFRLGRGNTGFYQHRNFFGNFMMIACLCHCAMLAFLNSSKFGKVYQIAIIVASLFAIGAVGSRGSYLGFLLGLTIIIYLKLQLSSSSKSTVYKLAMAGGAIAVFGIAILGGLKIWNDRQVSKSGARDAAIQEPARLAYLSMAVDQIVEAPLVGFGSRSYQYKGYQYWSSNLPKDYPDHTFVHNEFIQAATDYGMVGFFLLGSSVVVVVIYGIKSAINFSNNRIKDSTLCYLAAGLAGLVAMTTHSMVSFPGHCLPNILFVALISAWLVNPGTSGNIYMYAKSKLAFGLVGLVLILCLAVSARIVIQETGGAVAFINERIKAEDLNWKVDDIDRSRWQRALENAVVSSPSYERYNKLTNLYMLEAKDDPEKLKLALDAAKKSIALHGEDPVNRLNLANIYLRMGDMESAEQEYLDAEIYAKYREHYFGYYRERADFYRYWAVIEGDKESAGAKFENALRDCQLSLNYAYRSRHPEWVRIYSQTLLAYHKYLSARKDYDKGDAIFDEYYTFAMKGLLNENYKTQFQFFTYQVLSECMIAGNQRRIDRHLKLLQQSHLALGQMIRVFPDLKDANYRAAMDYITKRKADMRRAGFNY